MSNAVTRLLGVGFFVALVLASAGATPAQAQSECCTSLTTFANNRGCGTPTVTAITATGGPNSGELVCTIDWTYNFAASCGTTDRTIRYCVVLRSGAEAGSPPSCAHVDTYVGFQCVDDIPMSSGSTSEDFVFTGLTSNAYYYCTIATIDVEGDSCGPCGDTCGTFEVPCDHHLAGGKGTCGQAT